MRRIRTALLWLLALYGLWRLDGDIRAGAREVAALLEALQAIERDAAATLAGLGGRR